MSSGSERVTAFVRNFAVFSLRCIILTCICSCRNKLCSLTMNFWAHAVIFTAKSCLFLMLHHLRPGNYNYLILFFSPVPGAQRIIFYIVNDVLQNIFIIICSGPETSGMIQNSYRNPSIQHPACTLCTSFLTSHPCHSSHSHVPKPILCE